MEIGEMRYKRGDMLRVVGCGLRVVDYGQQYNNSTM